MVNRPAAQITSTHASGTTRCRSPEAVTCSHVHPTNGEPTKRSTYDTGQHYPGLRESDPRQRESGSRLPYPGLDL